MMPDKRHYYKNIHGFRHGIVEPCRLAGWLHA